METLQFDVRNIHLGHSTAAQRDDGVQFLHHINIIQAVPIIPAPADIFVIAGHIFLPVEIIGLVAGLSKLLPAVVQHPGDLLTGGELLPVFKKVGALF